MKQSLKTPIAFTLAALFAFAVALRAEAGVVLFDLNYNFGTVNAGGNVIVKITDSDPNFDYVTIAVTNHSEGFISDLFLNYSPNAHLDGATIENFIGGISVAEPSIHFNALQGFAINFGYQTANNKPGRFAPGESISFDLDAAFALTAAGFNEPGGKPTGDDYYAAAHVIAVTATGACVAGSAKIGDTDGGSEGSVIGGRNVTSCGGLLVPSSAVPEPATFALLGLGLAGLGFARRKLN